MNQATYEIVQPAVPAEALPPTKVKGGGQPSAGVPDQSAAVI
jgi:hypothetical protein